MIVCQAYASKRESPWMDCIAAGMRRLEESGSVGLPSVLRSADGSEVVYTKLLSPLAAACMFSTWGMNAHILEETPSSA